MDLVKDAGIDVSAWADGKGGAAKAAANPKYCYEWSFVEPGKSVLFNVWYDQMQETCEGGISCNLNPRDFASKRKGPERRRGLEMDKAIKTALIDALPIRIVVLGGRRRNITDPNENASKVSARLLDPVAWSITAYDERTGACTLTRGAERYVDQVSMRQESTALPSRRQIFGEVFDRSRLVRSSVLLRAKGICEWCGKKGFDMANGGIYMETHHIVPLSAGGSDSESNIVALCPNHHREAHYGLISEKMQTDLLARKKIPMSV
jgi:hypothetical protein